MSATETIDQTANRRTINGMTIDTVSLDDIIVGRRLESPLFDVHGVLLLAAGSIVTREIKQAIRNRGDRNVCLSKQDAKRLTLQQNSVSSLQHTTALGGELSEGGCWSRHEKFVNISANVCSFSAVSAPIFESKYAFFRIF